MLFVMYRNTGVVLLSSLVSNRKEKGRRNLKTNWTGPVFLGGPRNRVKPNGLLLLGFGGGLKQRIKGPFRLIKVNYV